MMLFWLLSVLCVAVAQGEVCPNGQQCSSGTCCPSDSPSQPYGCCPFNDAVCCADMEHCCPKGYICNLAHLRCEPEESGAPVLRMAGGRSQQRLALSAGLGHECPDGKKSCADTATCCQVPGGGYACCPEQNAVCCQDHIHCCPEGTKCDVKARSCVQERRHALLNVL